MKLEVWSSVVAILAALSPLGIDQRAIAEPLPEQTTAPTLGVESGSPTQSSVQSPTTAVLPQHVQYKPASIAEKELAKASPSAPNHSTNRVFDERDPSLLDESVVASDTSTEPDASIESSLLETTQISLNAETWMGQITAVTQLSDVQPTDWAYQALQSLVERYGCIAGYPDNTFRERNFLTRYEFAAGLNACLDRINELLGSSLEGLASQEGLATLQRLQDEFAAELATLRGRVDSLEARTAELEANQFSTTTVLNGTTWFNLTQAFPAGDILTERSSVAPGSPFAPPTRDANNRPTRVFREQPEATFSYYSFLTLNTSFTGRDSLVTQFAVGNGNSPANQLVSAGFYNSWGTPFLDQTGTPTAGDFILRELFYSFPIGDDVQVSVGPRLNYYRYFDGNRFTFYLNGATSFNSTGSTLLNAIDRGSGAVVSWAIADPLDFTLGYLAENTEFLSPAVFNTSNDPSNGLFNSSNTITAQLAYSPSNTFNLRLIYARSSLKPYNGYIGGAVGEPLPYGYADDGFGGTVRDSGADTFVANFDWLIDDWIGLFGRYSYGVLDINPTNPNRSGGDIRVQSFQVGLGFPNLFKEGAQGVISFVMPHDYLEGREFLLSGGGDGGTQYELELSYRYPVNDNIAIVPAFYTIWNANNFDSNPTVFIGNLRTQFTF